MQYTIRNEQLGANVAQYAADAPKLPYEIDPAYVGSEFVTYDEEGNAVDVAAIKPPNWRIDVGAGGGQPQLVTSMALASRPLAVAFTPSGRRLHVGIDWHDAFTESIVIVELTS